jgi:hypothetical protein
VITNNTVAIESVPEACKVFMLGLKFGNDRSIWARNVLRLVNRRSKIKYIDRMVDLYLFYGMASDSF